MLVLMIKRLTPRPSCWLLSMSWGFSIIIRSRGMSGDPWDVALGVERQRCWKMRDAASPGAVAAGLLAFSLFVLDFSLCSRLYL